ncbi:MAG TPA: NapC/NirT family cytochrome c [Steroidobacteraceae bacterium]|nr:NapC/NirT family cytochrome c [Steroidobacteraceae bacterium]
MSLWSKPRRRWLLGIPLGGFLLLGLGALGWAAFDSTLHYTNSLTFCTSCHEMRDNMLAEYQRSPHYKNAAGVRAICSDCHVPRAFFPKMQAKMAATVNELPKWVMGTRRPPEKFAAARLEMAEHVWARMKANDSRECRNCHSVEAMDVAAQDSSAGKKHNVERMRARGETCIDCHKGIGHGLPPGYDE